MNAKTTKIAAILLTLTNIVFVLILISITIYGQTEGASPSNAIPKPSEEEFADSTEVVIPVANASNNRLTGYTFDSAGNVSTDAEGRTFTYDAENKQKEAKNSSSATLGQYFFDGDGKRVKKVVPDTGETTIFVYDASGKMVAEYSTNVVPAQDAKVNGSIVWGDGHGDWRGRWWADYDWISRSK